LKRAKARLKKFIKVIGGKVGMKLSNKSFSQEVWRCMEGLKWGESY